MTRIFRCHITYVRQTYARQLVQTSPRKQEVNETDDDEVGNDGKKYSDRVLDHGPRRGWIRPELCWVARGRACFP